MMTTISCYIMIRSIRLIKVIRKERAFINGITIVYWKVIQKSVLSTLNMSENTEESWLSKDDKILGSTVATVCTSHWETISNDWFDGYYIF